jgi:hypothetical protein
MKRTTSDAVWVMEEGPPESTDRGGFQTAVALRRSKAWVVSRHRKGKIICQVWAGKANASEPSTRGRKFERRCQNRGSVSPCNKSGRNLCPVQTASGLETARAQFRRSYGTCDTCSSPATRVSAEARRQPFCIRRSYKWQPHESESTESNDGRNSRYGGTRSSDEACESRGSEGVSSLGF